MELISRNFDIGIENIFNKKSSVKDKEEILPYEVASTVEIRTLFENQVSKKVNIFEEE